MISHFSLINCIVFEHRETLDGKNTMAQHSLMLKRQLLVLAHPDFSKPIFEIHPDGASALQLGATTVQGGTYTAFCSGKLYDAHTGHTATEQELLAIAETLKEFRTIIFGR
jgi:hypothetical protein